MLKNFKTFNLSVEFYRMTENLKLPRHLKDQFNRSSSSVSLNLAEGYGKSTYKDQRKYFHIALGSLRESQAVLVLARVNDDKILAKLDHLGASLYKLIHARPS